MPLPLAERRSSSEPKWWAVASIQKAARMWEIKYDYGDIWGKNHPSGWERILWFFECAVRRNCGRVETGKNYGIKRKERASIWGHKIHSAGTRMPLFWAKALFEKKIWGGVIIGTVARVYTDCSWLSPFLQMEIKQVGRHNFTKLTRILSSLHC